MNTYLSREKRHKEFLAAGPYVFTIKCDENNYHIVELTKRGRLRFKNHTPKQMLCEVVRYNLLHDNSLKIDKMEPRCALLLYILRKRHKTAIFKVTERDKVFSLNLETLNLIEKDVFCAGKSLHYCREDNRAEPEKIVHSLHDNISFSRLTKDHINFLRKFFSNVLYFNEGEETDIKDDVFYFTIKWYKYIFLRGLAFWNNPENVLIQRIEKRIYTNGLLICAGWRKHKTQGRGSNYIVEKEHFIINPYEKTIKLLKEDNYQKIMSGIMTPRVRT